MAKVISQKTTRLDKKAKKGVINNAKDANTAQGATIAKSATRAKRTGKGQRATAKRTGKGQDAVMMPEGIDRTVTIKVLGHRASQATRVMEMLQVQSIVRIRISTDVETNPRAATFAQLEELDSYIREQVLCRMPFPKGQGQIIYCRHDSHFADECILNSYQAVLDAAFGKGRFHARIYRIGDEA